MQFTDASSPSPLPVRVLHADATSACLYFEAMPPACMAALQEALVNDVPCVGIHTLHLDDASPFQHGEVLAMRMGHTAWACPPWTASSTLTAARHHGTFYKAAPGSVQHLCAKDIKWTDAEGAPCDLTPVFPEARLVPVTPRACVAGEVVAAWGVGRHGQAWRVVPDVRWSFAERVTWHMDPTLLPEPRQTELVEATVYGVDIMEAPEWVWACAGLRELVDHAPEADSAAWSWRSVFTLQSDAAPPALLTFTTNGQLPPLVAFAAACHVLLADTTELMDNTAAAGTARGVTLPQY